MGEFSFLLQAPAAFLSLLWLTAALLSLWFKGSRDYRRLASSIACGLFAAGIIFAFCKPAFRVLNDETAFLNMAQALLATLKPGRGPEWMWLAGALKPVEDIAPFRPVLFPVLTALAGIGGKVTAWHAFMVNFLATGALFALLAHKCRGLYASAAVLLAILSGAVFWISVASAGYDILSLCLGCTTVLLLQRYRSAPSSAAFVALLGAALCFAQTRIEGALGFGILWLSLLSRARALTKPEKATLLLAPLLLLPVLFQRLNFYPHVELNSVGELVAPGFVPGNSWEFLKAFFLEAFGPFPVLLHWIGLWGLWKKCRCRAPQVWIPVAIYLGIYLAFLFFFHDGGIRHPFQARLYLPFSFLLVWAAAAFPRTRMERRVVLVATIAQLAFAIPHIRTGYLYFLHPSVEEVAALREWVEKSPEKALIVTFNSGSAAAFGRAAVRPQTFDRLQPWIRETVEKEKIGPVWIMETWPPHKMAIVTSVAEGDTKPVGETQLSGMRQLRVRELVTFPAGPRAPEPK